MRTCATILAILVTVATGCGRNAGVGAAVVPVQGRVTLDGKPLGLKSVLFVPEPGTPGNGAGGTTKEDGSYSLLAVRPGAMKDVSGVAPGAYLVVVTEPMFPADAKLPQGPAGEPAAAVTLGDVAEQKPSVIPAQYRKPETTKLRVEVPREGGTLDLNLTSKP